MSTANQNWRIDNAGRLLSRYRDNETLKACWQAAFDAGIPEDERHPWGATNPLADTPSDGLFSEFILRAFESYLGRGTGEFPELGFKADLKAIARNLETAARIAVEGYGVKSVSPALIPLGWLRGAAEFAWYRSAPGVPDPRIAITRDFLTEGNPYPYLSALWDAWGMAPKPDDYVYRENQW